jgi:folylpolyglutamate synthase/dihydropteroate synthase
MGADKDADSFLTVLAPLIKSLIITRADSPRAADSTAIAEAADALRIPYDVQPSVALAIDSAKERHSGAILITGSLFVVGEAREAFGLAEPDLVWQALNRAGISPSGPRKFA